jgi:hypothetical protein
MSIEKRIARLEGLSDSDSIRTFESFMLECTKVTDALGQGVGLDTIKPKRFDPVMRPGIVRSLPDIERIMCECLENEGTLPLELTAQLIVIYRDPDARALLTPTLKELVETIFRLERDGKLTVGAE